MKLEQLTWDSDFFGIKIGKINFYGLNDDFLSLLAKAKEEKYKLIYVFSDEDLFINNDVVAKNNGKLVDRKIVFQKKVSEQLLEKSISVLPFQFAPLNDDLLDLAYVSGEFSRFKLDEKLPAGSFEKLYKAWIEKSLDGQLADAVFVAKENEKNIGFVTLKLRETIGEIGLIAVDNSAQGKGIGSKLLDACENYLIERSVDVLQVPTQLQNVQACRFYERYGFEKHLITNIYHFWTNR